MSSDKIKQAHGDVEWVTSTEQGRRFLWSILSHCGVFHDIEGSDNQVFKQIGRRQVGLHLTSLITDYSDERFIRMQQEAFARAAQEKLDYDNRNSDTSSSGTPSISTGDSDFPGHDSGTSGSVF